MATILIPVQGSEEVVEVQVSELPDDANDIVDILQAEMAPLDLWLKFAVEYYKQGRLEQFKLLLDPLVELEMQGALYDQFGNEPAVKKQFIAILNALAAYHMVGATRDRDKQKKKAGFEQAKKYYDAADVIDVQDGRAMLGAAVLDLCQGQLVKAEKRLDLAAQFYHGAKSGNVPALLGQASVKFQMGQTKEALKLYREVFFALPTPPAPVRLGLAFCFAKLGQSALARRALERTLSLQEDNVEALTALAVIRLNEDNVAEALQLLKRAYELEPSHPATLNQLANHYFYKAEHAKAQTLAKRSYLASASPAIRAEACFHMARSFHAQGDHSSALQWYTQSGKERPEYPMPLFGLGQMHMSHGEGGKAALYFERALKHAPESVETLRVLGHLYAASDRRVLALQHLSRATELAPDDVGAWLEMAKLHESRDAPTALKAYEAAAGLLKRSERRVPLELWNNIGVLRHQLGKLATAEKAYRHALAAAAAEGGASAAAGAQPDARCATINFNLARLSELRGERTQAAEGYKALLREHPTYLDSFLRLAACARADGHPIEAVGWLKRALEVDPTSADAWCALGELQVSRREWVAADAAFRHVLTKCVDAKGETCKRDAYAQVSLANIQYIQYIQAGGGGGGGGSREGQQARLDKATEMYRSVLQHEPNNVYAANGLGTVCVEKGRLQEAREIFTVVREAAAGCDHALLNLAQVHAVQKEHTAAVAGYQKVQRKGHGGRSAEVWALQARAHFEADKLPEARRALCKAIHLQPADLLGWHHLALVALRGGVARRDADDTRSTTEIEVARAQLALALRLCDAAARAPEAALAAAGAAGLEATRLAAVREGCAAEGARLEEELADARSREEVESAQRRSAEAAGAELQAKRDAEAVAKEAEAEAAAAAEVERIRQQKEKASQILAREGVREAEAAAAEADKEKGKKKREKRKRDAEGEEERSENSADEEPAAEPDPEVNDDDLFGSDSDGEGGKPGQGEGKPAQGEGAEEEDLFGDGDEGAPAPAVDAELEALEDVGAPGAGGGGKKRRKIVDDEEDDEEEAGAAGGLAEDEAEAEAPGDTGASEGAEAEPEIPVSDDSDDGEQAQGAGSRKRRALADEDEAEAELEAEAAEGAADADAPPAKVPRANEEAEE